MKTINKSYFIPPPKLVIPSNCTWTGYVINTNGLDAAASKRNAKFNILMEKARGWKLDAIHITETHNTTVASMRGSKVWSAAESESTGDRRHGTATLTKGQVLNTKSACNIAAIETHIGDERHSLLPQPHRGNQGGGMPPGQTVVGHQGKKSHLVCSWVLVLHADTLTSPSGPIILNNTCITWSLPGQFYRTALQDYCKPCHFSSILTSQGHIEEVHLSGSTDRTALQWLFSHSQYHGLPSRNEWN